MFRLFSKRISPPKVRSGLLLLAAACMLVAQPVFTEEPSHVVARGETLSQIAERHATTVRELQKLNGIDDPRKLRIGQKLKLPAKDRPYTVKSGDVLSKIARDHAVTVQQILDTNNMDNPHRLRVGQVLRIPFTAATYRPVPAIPATLRRDLDPIRVNRRQWEFIVLHHSGTARGKTADMDRYHREERRMSNGLAYHFVIGNGNGMADGQIDVGQRWRRQIQGGHVASEAMNRKAIGICLVGNFDEKRPTPKQMESLEALTRYLMQQASVPARNVRTHTQINSRPTRCPGKNFPTATFMSRIGQ